VESTNTKYQRANAWSKIAIGAALEVHSLKGAGLIESIYERCMLREFELRKIPVLSQLDVQIEYKGCVFSEPLTVDLYVDDCLLIELKAVQTVLPIHKAQLLSYMKLLDAPIGLLINFHQPSLKDGIHRLLLPGSSGQTTEIDNRKKSFSTEVIRGNKRDTFEG
jgi:GxxExxY protein